MTANVMKRLVEQSYPLPSGIGVGIQLHDQLGNPGLEETKADIRQPECPNKLTIPVTSVRLPEFSESCVQSPCESVFPPFPVSMHNQDCTSFRARNIIVFGESGVGKSSVINMIAGKCIAQTSDDAVGCTFRNQCYQISLDGLIVNLWDTAGLDEGTEGTIPAGQAENSLKAFLRQITRWNGIDLLLYCIRGTRVRQALLRNYSIFYAAICRKKVPIGLVVTGLENYEGDMEAWWAEHEGDLIKHGMRFDAHACVTTMHSDHPAIQDRLKHSRTVLRALVRENFDTTAWKADEDSLISASLPDAHALLREAGKRVTPLIMVCDSTAQPNQTHLFPTCTGEREYKCRYVDAQQTLLGDPKRCTEMAERPDLLIFCADVESDWNRTWAAFERFYTIFRGETCPIIVVFRGLDSHEAAVKTWRLLSSSRGGAMIAIPTYYPGPDSPREMVERADMVLAALVEGKCLAKFEEKEKLSKFQKFCRNSKIFFTGRM